MALFDEQFIQETIARVRQHYLELGAALGELDKEECGDQATSAGALLDDLKLLTGVANGAYQRTDEMMQEVEMALARLLDVLFGNALQSKTIIPDSFWKTKTGVLVSRVRWWISVDELITISNAAALAFGENTQANRMRIVRAIDNGLLEWVPDPSVANPQQNKRVLRPQVERLRDQRRLPE